MAAGDTIPAPAKPAIAVNTDTFAVGNNMDIVDVLKLIFRFKKNPFHKQTKQGGVGPFYTLFAYPGYNIVTGFAAIAAVNISFRTPKNPYGNLSFINNNFQYTQKNQILILSLSNFYTNDNKWQFPGDLRFYHFPTLTYGLGSNTLPQDEDNIDYYHFRFYRNAMREVVDNTFLGVGYNLDYRWDITDYNAEKGPTPFSTYGYSKTSTSSGLSLDFLYDTKNNENRPIFGTYVNFQVISYLKIMGSNSNWSSMVIDLRKYVPLTRKWYFDVAFWGYAWLTLNGKPPYLDMPSTGWDSYNNTGRGYGAGRFRGQDMLYFETEFRFDLMRNGLLGAVVFGNVETLAGYPAKYFGPIQPGGGVGLRIKFNKRTQSNSAFDWGFGTHNSNGAATNINEVF